LRETDSDFSIELLGVNLITRAAFNGSVTAGRSIPWLQDTDAQRARERWGAAVRDVRILDGRNHTVAVLNLNTHDLSLSHNRALLKSMLLDAARAVDSDGDGLPDAWELRHFGDLSQGPRDDPDGDGRDNAAEFAFGTDPLDAGSFSPMQPLVNGQGSKRQFGVAFRQFSGGMVRYRIETSSDFITWTGIQPDEIGDRRPLYDGSGMVEVFYSLRTAMEFAPAGFIRVRAEPRLVVEP
jgi:hypothetical protein